MLYLNLDENDYLLSVSGTKIEGPAIESLEGFDLTGDRILAHRFDGENLVFDEEKWKQIQASDHTAQYAEIEELKAKLASYDYIGIKIAMGVATKEEYADQIAETKVWRNRIAEIEEKIAES